PSSLPPPTIVAIDCACSDTTARQIRAAAMWRMRLLYAVVQCGPDIPVWPARSRDYAVLSGAPAPRRRSTGEGAGAPLSYRHSCLAWKAARQECLAHTLT